MYPLSQLDIAAVVFFVAAWAFYAALIERTGHGRRGLNARMNGYREVWVRRMIEREVRIPDVQILASLQSGTAFFASTTLLAIGGTLTLLRSSDDVLTVVSQLPFSVPVTRGLWELKTIGLVLIFVYAFFKFAWSYRLFNYVSILFGAMPPAAEQATAEGAAHVRRTTKLFESAGKHFNRGQRAFFFALGYLGWFVGPAVLMATTLAIAIVMWRRQFASESYRAMLDA
jgi:uncharacterized membrane protein